MRTIEQNLRAYHGASVGAGSDLLLIRIIDSANVQGLLSRGVQFRTEYYTRQ
ncbi:MAG: hypothetical protein WDO73_01845 [Ignavibacteriota bacterium]